MLLGDMTDNSNRYCVDDLLDKLQGLQCDTSREAALGFHQVLVLIDDILIFSKSAVETVMQVPPEAALYFDYMLNC